MKYLLTSEKVVDEPCKVLPNLSFSHRSENGDGESQKPRKRLGQRKNKKKSGARSADKRKKGLVPNTEFDLTKSFDLDRSARQKVRAFFCVLFWLFPKTLRPAEA